MDEWEQEVARLLRLIRPWGTLECLQDVITSKGWDVILRGEYPEYRLCYVVRDRWGAYTLDEVRDALEEWRPCGVRVTVDA